MRGCSKRPAGVFEFFGDLSVSPSFVFRELGHVPIPEFGDLILNFSSSRRGASKCQKQKQIPRRARVDNVKRRDVKPPKAEARCWAEAPPRRAGARNNGEDMAPHNWFLKILLLPDVQVPRESAILRTERG